MRRLIETGAALGAGAAIGLGTVALFHSYAPDETLAQSNAPVYACANELGDIPKTVTAIPKQCKDYATVYSKDTTATVTVYKNDNRDASTVTTHSYLLKTASEFKRDELLTPAKANQNEHLADRTDDALGVVFGLGAAVCMNAVFSDYRKYRARRLHVPKHLLDDKQLA